MKRSTEKTAFRRQSGRRRIHPAAAPLFFFISTALLGCSVDSTRSRFLMAERLWEQGDYKAAVTEFDRVAARDRYGVLGKRATLRAAITQGLFLKQYPAAVKKLRDFIESEGDTPESWEARRTIGDILFEREQNFEQSLEHYQDMLTLRPKDSDAPLYRERIAFSYLRLSQFNEAFDVFEELARTESGTPRGERAALELGEILYTQGDQRPPRRFAETPKLVFKEAIRRFETFMTEYPQSSRIAEARFGVASCLAELDQLDQAEAILLSIQFAYPSPGVVAVKLARIRERRANRGFHRTSRQIGRPQLGQPADAESSE